MLSSLGVRIGSQSDHQSFPTSKSDSQSILIILPVFLVLDLTAHELSKPQTPNSETSEPQSKAMHESKVNQLEIDGLGGMDGLPGRRHESIMLRAEFSTGRPLCILLRNIMQLKWTQSTRSVASEDDDNDSRAVCIHINPFIHDSPCPAIHLTLLQSSKHVQQLCSKFYSPSQTLRDSSLDAIIRLSFRSRHPNVPEETSSIG